METWCVDLDVVFFSFFIQMEIECFFFIFAFLKLFGVVMILIEVNMYDRVVYYCSYCSLLSISSLSNYPRLTRLFYYREQYPTTSFYKRLLLSVVHFYKTFFRLHLFIFCAIIYLFIYYLFLDSGV